MDWDKLLADCVDFAQRLIRTPSMPGQEAALAALVADELRVLVAAGASAAVMCSASRSRPAA